MLLKEFKVDDFFYSFLMIDQLIPKGEESTT